MAGFPAGLWPLRPEVSWGRGMPRPGLPGPIASGQWTTHQSVGLVGVSTPPICSLLQPEAPLVEEEEGVKARERGRGLGAHEWAPTSLV